MLRVGAGAVLLALSIAFPLHAASAHFFRLSVRDGLSQSSVESIGEDRYGFLWFGTQEGLSRFDGYEFEVHQASRRPGHLRDGFIRAIAPDRRGDLWIGTSTGLQHLDVARSRFTESVTPDGAGVRLNTLRIAPDGRLWFAGFNTGLWTHSGKPAAMAQRVAFDGPGDALVSAVALGADGTLWITTGGDLLALRISENDGVVSAKAQVRLRGVGFVRAMHLEDGMLWLGRQDAAPLRFDPRTGRSTVHPELPTHVLTIASAGEGRLWLGGKGAGVTRFDPATREVLAYRHEPGNEDSLAEDDVAVVHLDRGGNLWAGAWNGGLSRLNLHSQALSLLRSTPGQPLSLPDDDVTRMAEGPNGRLWTISRNDVLAAGDARTGAFTAIPLQRDFTALAFAGPRLFAGTTTGLLELDPSGRLLPPGGSIRAAGLDRMPIQALTGARGALWIVAGGAIHRMAADGSILRAGLPGSEEPTGMDAATADRAWVAYEDRTLHRAEVTGTSLTVRPVADPAVAARGRLNSVTEHRGVVWIGAALGFGRLDVARDRVEWIDVPEMPSRSVGSILVDDDGVLWIAANRGIMRYDPVTRRAAHFGAAQGAQDSGYVDGGAARGASGLFYFAGRGITVFDPRRVADNPFRPRVVFTGLEILHRPVLPSWRDAGSPLTTGIHAAEEVTLGPDAVVFSVEMAAPGTSDPDGVRFAWRLDGFDRDWIETGADRRVATYTRLAPGRYVIRARARTSYGAWSAHETTLRIRILPPWWRAPRAIAFWIALAMLGVVALVAETRRRTRMRISVAEQEALRRASMTDPLTGLYNRRFLAEWLKHEIPRVLRTHRAPDGEREWLLVVAADLDNLKNINDAWGHDAGDIAIRAVAELLQSQARAGDLAVRLGGDEFVLVLRSADRSQPGAVAERLRAAVDRLDLGFDEAARPTLSLGVATFPFLEHDPEALKWDQTLQLADRALLHSKRRGRNAWTAFVATSTATADAVRQELTAGMDRPASTVIRLIEGAGTGRG